MQGHMAYFSVYEICNRIGIVWLQFKRWYLKKPICFLASNFSFQNFQNILLFTSMELQW